jgi:hypothetical protein
LQITNTKLFINPERLINTFLGSEFGGFVKDNLVLLFGSYSGCGTEEIS